MRVPSDHMRLIYSQYRSSYLYAVAGTGYAHGYAGVCFGETTRQI